MAKILKIYKEKDSIFRTKCRDILHMESWVMDLANDMWMTMLSLKAEGLAANQVGFDYNMITVKGEMLEGPMINPIIVEKSREIFHYAEKCLSIPGYEVDTGKRSKVIKVKYNDLQGLPQTTWLKDSTSIIVQHEIDHLFGVSMIDYVNQDLLDKKNEGGS